jgi:hypothetical protein
VGVTTASVELCHPDVGKNKVFFDYVCRSCELEFMIFTFVNVAVIMSDCIATNGRSQWPRGLRRGSTAAHLLRSWFRIPPEAWIFVCCVFSGRDLCDELITRPQESYGLWRVVVCDKETSWTRRP